VIQGGSTGVATMNGVSLSITGVTVTAETIGLRGEAAVSLDRTGAFAAYVAESYTSAPHISFGPLGTGKPVTRDNDALGRAVISHEVRWKNGGFDMQGWLLEPTCCDAAIVSVIEKDRSRHPLKSPMITIVHGGPASASTPKFPWGDEAGMFTAKGYWVLLPNPRGSYGQGAAFTRANVRDFGGGDLSDILAGIDAVEKAAPIDDARLGLYGHSYGGFMAMWTGTHSNRFKAIVAGAGIANWASYYGQNGIDQWMIPFFGASVYDDPKIYDALSPIRTIKDARAPTFLYVGERDVECPPAQSLEYWHGLKAMGVPTELVIYQDEGHGIRQPDHIRDREARITGWFDRYLGSAK
jgi:dipeptidyl aminopeptidase/acylaminoacyl peptidase